MIRQRQMHRVPWKRRYISQRTARRVVKDAGTGCLIRFSTGAMIPSVRVGVHGIFAKGHKTRPAAIKAPSFRVIYRGRGRIM